MARFVFSDEYTALDKLVDLPAQVSMLDFLCLSHEFCLSRRIQVLYFKYTQPPDPVKGPELEISHYPYGQRTCTPFKNSGRKIKRIRPTLDSR